MKRRRFLRLAGSGLAGSVLMPEWVKASRNGGGMRGNGGGIPLRGPLPLSAGPGEVHLVILHTNDTHSRMDPFPMDGGPFQGRGGVARRATLVRRVREENPHVLLLDSGDIFQGTPYFNFFHGEIEFRAMSAMGYDVATIGNHDFDNGVEGLAEMMPRATFDFVSANYEVAGSPLEARVRPWVIREMGGVRVGIFGLGIAFDGLVLESLHEGVRYADPFAAARRCVSELRARDCGLVVCLSHLGYRYRGNEPSDSLLAREVEGIDLILGGHTHTFLARPDVYFHSGGRQTLVSQVGWGGMRLGRVDAVLTLSGGTLAASPPAPLRFGWGGYEVDGSLD